MATTWDLVSVEVQGEKTVVAIQEVIDAVPSTVYTQSMHSTDSFANLRNRFKAQINADRVKRVEDQARIDSVTATINSGIGSFEAFLNQ